MTRRISIRIIFILFIVFGILALLIATTNMPNEKSNGFVRKWLSIESVKPETTLKLEEPLSMIVGTSKNYVFIAGENPTGILQLSKDFKRKDTLIMNYDLPPNKLSPFNMQIDSPHIYIQLNNLSTAIYGKFPNDTLQEVKVKSGVFLKSVQLSPEILIVKSIDLVNRIQPLIKVETANAKELARKNVSEELDTTMGISTDGFLVFSKTASRIFYVEQFRNRFYCLDTSLNLVYKNSSIDTVSAGRIHISEQKLNDSTNKYIPTNSRVSVNDGCAVDDKYLLIVSAMRSDNQTIREFNLHVNIDVYTIDSGIYIGSLSLVKPEKEKFKSLKIDEDMIWILFDKSISSYKKQTLLNQSN